MRPQKTSNQTSVKRIRNKTFITMCERGTEHNHKENWSLKLSTMPSTISDTPVVNAPRRNVTFLRCTHHPRIFRMSGPWSLNRRKRYMFKYATRELSVGWRWDFGGKIFCRCLESQWWGVLKLTLPHWKPKHSVYTVNGSTVCTYACSSSMTACFSQ